MSVTLGQIELRRRAMHEELAPMTGAAAVLKGRRWFHGEAFGKAMARFNADPCGPDGDALLAWLDLVREFAELVRGKR